jgi:hypothetical protein
MSSFYAKELEISIRDLSNQRDALRADRAALAARVEMLEGAVRENWRQRLFAGGQVCGFCDSYKSNAEQSSDHAPDCIVRTIASKP